MVTVGTFAATVGAEPVLTGDTGGRGGRASADGPGRSSTSADPGDRFLKVLVVGDSQGATLAQGPGAEGGQHGLAVQPHVLVWNRALLGCAISTRPTFVVNGETMHNKCGADGVWQRLWSTDVAQFEPDVVVVAAGAWDLYDVVLDDGRVVAPGDDPTWAAGYEHDVVQMFEELGATGAPVIAVVPPCYGDNTYPGAGAAALRSVTTWHASARSSGCGPGRARGRHDDGAARRHALPRRSVGSSLRPDGTHFDGAGADRIAPAVMATVRAALARSTASVSLRCARRAGRTTRARRPSRASCVGLVRPVGVGERVPADPLGHADERVREHHAGARGEPWISIRVLTAAAASSSTPSTTSANSGSLRIDAPNSRRNAARSLVDEVEVGGEALPRPGPGRSSTLARRLGELVEQPAADVVEHLDEQRPLAREVLVETGLVTPAASRDVVHRRGVEAALGELDARDVEQLLAALVGREPRRRDATRCRHPPVLDFSGIT